MFQKGKSWVKFGFVLTILFDQTCQMGQILIKTVILPKVRHIQLNCAFLLFWSIFVKIHRELLFLVKKMAIPERSTEKLRKFVFLNMFENGKSWVKLGFVKTNIFDQTSKKGQILKKKVSPPKMSHIQLNYAFLLFWSIFLEIHREPLFLVKKLLSPKGALKYSENLFFLTCLKRVNPE